MVVSILLGKHDKIDYNEFIVSKINISLSPYKATYMKFTATS